MTRLSVNLNAVAFLRNRRDLPWPSVTGIARIVLDAGADGITVHPRPDERHIRRSDVFELAELLAADPARREFNIEGYPTPEFLELVREVRPAQVTLVPDSPEQATSDHGWDVKTHETLLREVVAELKGQGMRVSLFLDAEPQMVEHAAKTGADRIELYTAPYAAACLEGEFGPVLARFSETAEAALASGLAVNAGHDLSLDNLAAFKAGIPGLSEVSIGHAITADALVLGFAEAVRRYRDAL